MEIFGPFFVVGRAVSTGLNPQPGDSLAVLASGVVTVLRPSAPAPDAVSADGLADAMGTPLVAPSGWQAPGLRQLSLVGRVGTRPIQLANGLTAIAAAPVGGELTLDVNAPSSTQYEEGGWSVYVARARAGEQAPHLRDWVFFEDLTTVPTDVSIRGLAAAELGNVIHVFWSSEDGASYGLNHLTIRPDGTIGPTANIDPRAVGVSQVSAVVHRGVLNVFYCANQSKPFPEIGTLQVLRRAVLNPAGAFDFFDIDGIGGTTGAIRGVLGLFNSAVSSGNDLHVIYSASLTGADPAEDLRHARVTISGPEVVEAPFVWLAETIDGAGGGSGQISGDTGASIAALVDVAGQVQAFYFLGAITGRPPPAGLDLRHAELAWVGGAVQQRWRLETLDGAGWTLRDASGQRGGNMGLGIGCVLHNGEQHVFYSDFDHGNLRWAVKVQGYPWALQTIDGLAIFPGGRGHRYGPTSNRISAAPKSAVSFGDQVSLLYEDVDQQEIRHAYRRPGLPWMMEVVDGDITLGGRVRSQMSNPVAVIRGGFLNVIYFDAGRRRLRHAVLSR